MEELRHGSLFSGIGGFDLAAEWMGWKNVFHCELNPFGRKILNYYWPNSISYEDIKTTDFTIHRGKIDILTGGFPCQPFSTAGKRKGKEDERHLWPEMLRAIREIQPRYIVGENVFGLINWSGGLVFEEVQADLEAEGYDVQPFILPAASVGAPHRRDRIWFVAYCSGFGRNNRRNYRQKRYFCDNIDGYASKNKSKRSGRKCRISKIREVRYAPNADGRRQPRKEHRETKPRRASEKSVSNYWQNFPTQSPICNGNNGLSSRLDGITFPKWRNESIKGGGNAIVPQVVLQIFKSIIDYENHH